MKQQNQNRKVGILRTTSLLVLFVFSISIFAVPLLTTKAIAAEEAAAAAAGAGAAGASGGGRTAAGIRAGTIAVGVVIAAAVGVALASSGGENHTYAVAATPSTAGTDLAKTNPAASSATAAALGTLDSTDLAALATASTALGTTGQATLATNAKTMTAAQFAAYLQGGGGYAAGTPQYTALRGLYSSFTPAQLLSLQTMYAAAVVGGVVDAATLAGIATVISTTATGTPAQQAENLRQAILAILTARHPGATITVTVSHLGNNVYTTTSHVR